MPSRPVKAQGLLFPEELARRIGRRRTYATGAQLFAAGTTVRGLHLIVAGSVRILRGSGNRSLVVHREAAGGVLGEVALFGSGRYPATAVAVEPMTALFLPAEPLANEITRSPSLARLFLSRLARRAEGLIERMDQHAHQTVIQRLARHLSDRRSHGTGGTVSLGMTQAELAEELATVKEVVVRSLASLRRLGLIEPVGRGRYRVVDPRRLAQLAG